MNSVVLGQPTTPQLSRRQQRVLDFVRDFWARKGYSPANREIGDACGIRSSSNVSYVVDSLVSLGYLLQEPLTQRTIRPVTQEGDVCPCCGERVFRGGI